MIHLTKSQQNSRFLKGFFRLFITLAVIYITQYKWDLTHLQFEFSDYLEKNLGGFLAGLIMLIMTATIGYTLIKNIISGIYFMITWEIPLPVYEDKVNSSLTVYNNSNYSNINRILQYREAQMGLMTNDEAAKFFMQTSKLDNLYTSNIGSNTKKTVDYIEGKLGLMTNDQGIDFISGNLK